jgi:hypothetical protein
MLETIEGVRSVFLARVEEAQVSGTMRHEGYYRPWAFALDREQE